jgi:hypothetical protein
MPWSQMIAKMTAECGISHKHRKYVRFTKLLQYKYYEDLTYTIMDHPYI